MIESTEIEKQIGVKFNNSAILEKAFTHRSFLNENKGKGLENNERLEFLGDAVLELIISQHLFTKYPLKTEGELTSIRAALVRTESLAEETKQLNIGQYLRMSKGEQVSGGQEKEYLLANLYEATLGAIYLDSGYEKALQFVERTLLKRVGSIVKEKLFIDPKTKVQEVLQSKYKVTPTYEIVKEEGPDHQKIFTVSLKMGNKKVTEGHGQSKQKAEEDAAKNALDIIDK